MSQGYFDELHDDKMPPAYRWFNGVSWTSSTNGHFIPVVSPIDNATLGRVPVVTHEEIDLAIKNAHTAQRLWREKTLVERGKILMLAADWIREHESYLTAILVSEIGKPMDEAKDELLRSADMIDY